jgi:hypothetical protein
MPEKRDVIIKLYAHTLANRRYGIAADDLFDENVVEINGFF